MAVDFPSPGGPESSKATFDRQPFAAQHLAIADRGGDEIQFLARPLVRDHVLPGAIGYARPHRSQVSIDEHDPVFERIGLLQQAAHERDDFGLVRLPIKDGDS